VWVRTRLAAASDKVYQLLAHGRWFSPASSTTKPGRHDIAEILLTVALNTKNQIKSTNNKDYILSQKQLPGPLFIIGLFPYFSCRMIPELFI
jgi:hypothetical protein